MQEKNMNLYQLTEADYRLLWMVASPEEIIFEFGPDRTKSRRTIYRIYEKLNFSGIKHHRKQLKIQLERQQPLWSPSSINGHLRRQERSEREKAYAELWERIEAYEATFNAHS